MRSVSLDALMANLNPDAVNLIAGSIDDDVKEVIMKQYLKTLGKQATDKVVKQLTDELAGQMVKEFKRVFKAKELMEEVKAGVIAQVANQVGWAVDRVFEGREDW